ncbi:MAG: FtsX-like permease family protein [Muribaculaceae bacterium]|nr:FtsX-like permease family protein [Muribaculaceae bacterium]
MNFPLYISRRLRLNPTNKKGRSAGVVIAVAGVSIAIAVMIITLATVLGFKNAIEKKVEGFDSQITVEAIRYTGYPTPLNNIEIISQLITEACEPFVPDISPSAHLTGVMKTDNDFAGMVFKSIVDSTIPYNFISDAIIESKIPVFTDSTALNNVIVSQTTANALQLKTGDRVYAYFIDKSGVKTRRLTVTAIYNTSFLERDKIYCYVSPPFLDRLTEIEPGQAMSLEVNGLPLKDISDYREKIQTKLNNAYRSRIIDQTINVIDVKQTGAVYFSWLELLDTNVAVIIILMTIIASFTLVSSLFIIILERVNLIGLLKALGATNRQTRMIFIQMAMRIVFTGMIIGNAVALLYVFIQKTFHVIPLNPEAYYLSFVPVNLSVIHWIIVNVGAIVIGWIVLAVPAMIINRISPASTMRYE